MVSITTKLNRLGSLANSGGIAGWLLLLYPVLYLIFSRQRDSNQYAAIDATALAFIAYTFIALAGAVVQFKIDASRCRPEILYRSPLLWFLAYTLLAGLSVFWSINFALTGFRALECLSMILLIAAVVHHILCHYNPSLLINWMILYIVVSIICSIIKGVTLNLDFFDLLQRSQMVATVFFYFAIFAKNKKWWHWLIIVMSIFSMSTVAYIGMALGLISFYWINRKFKPFVIFVSFLLFATAFVIGPEKLLKETIFFDKEEISMRYTSSRNRIMDIAVKSMDENNIGNGFFAGEAYALHKRGYYRVINGHNSFFSAMMGLGWPGVILIGIFLLTMTQITFSNYIPRKLKAPLIGCFCVAILQCMGNPGIGSRVYGGWIPVTLLFTAICGIYTFYKYYEIPDEDAPDPLLPADLSFFANKAARNSSRTHAPEYELPEYELPE